MRLDPGQIEVVDDVMVKILQQKSPAEKIKIGFSLWAAAHEMITLQVQKLHPEWDKTEVEREVAKRFLHGTI